jgi:peptidoglycan/xylan/chitin deacetylase (PgdA/CDA1 family)
MGSTVTVLAYHRIEKRGNPDLAPAVIDATPAAFEAQMRHVAAHYNVITSGDLVKAMRDGKGLPARAVIITFDDGYCSFKNTALPVLRRLGLPVSLFVVTHAVGVAGTPFWWDSLYRSLVRTCYSEVELPGLGVMPLHTPGQRRVAYDRIAHRIERTPWDHAERLLSTIAERCAVEPAIRRHVLDWDEIGELAAQGVEIGAHSRHHPVLSRTTPQRTRSEVAGAWADLRAHIPDPLPIFCYPTGKPHALDPRSAGIIRSTGYVGAYTMIPGLNRVGRTNPYRLHRVGMVAGEPLPRFALKITGAGRAYRALKSILKSNTRHQTNK